ncbi:MAG: metallophosphoesterase [Myxococcota bacterium]|nr:metallophosphoesterase [Myxococcota bacterium]
MWFALVGIGLAILLVGGLYARWRVAGALTELGVRERRVRWVRWVLAWLLFGYPLLVIGAIGFSLLTDRATLLGFEGPMSTWLLVYPFYVTLLAMLQALPYLLLLEVVHAVLRRRRSVAVARRVRAIAVLAVVLGFALYTPIRVVAERDALRVRHHQVERGTAGPRGAASPPFRIAFVADIQQDAHTDAARAADVVARINATRPDLVLSGGDWINTGPDYIAAAAKTAGALRSRLGTYSVRGDHEHFGYLDRERSVGEIERALAAEGVAMLSNQLRWFEHAGKRIGVLFLDYNYLHRTDDPTIAALIAGLAGADYSILVTHQFDAHVAALVKDRVDLVLGAHTHGGQVNPVLGVVHVPLARLETVYIDGRYQLGTTTVIVTAGVGYSLVPFRYASPAAVEILELRL